jgi:pimeloyl-ACP methyl ester carboxylesterase
MAGLYEAFSHAPDADVGTEVRWGIYRSIPKPTHNKITVQTPFSGFKNSQGSQTKTNEFNIAYTQWGDKGPLVLLLHGVPTNRRQWRPVQERLAPFCRTIAIDMLGMGESDKPLQYGVGEDANAVAKKLFDRDHLPGGEWKPWDWIFDVVYVEQLMQMLYGDEKFVFVADDWGSGINSHYAAQFGSQRLLAHIQLDPIAFDGYPVSEIQAIGRTSAIKDEAQFRAAMGAIDQTMVQIFKTMVHHPDKVYNQYSLRSIKFPYIDTDYERSAYRDGEDADSMTLRLHWDAIRVLADRAAVLAPALLLPFNGEKNPRGVEYWNIDVPTAVLWGQYDNMMPEHQRHRFIWAHVRGPVMPIRIGDAGHFAATDQPDWVADAILGFIIFVVGKENLGDIYLGLDGIWKGDESEMIRDLRMIYGL